MQRIHFYILVFLMLLLTENVASQDQIMLADGVIDTTDEWSLGLQPEDGVETFTIFMPNDTTDHYSNGVVMAAFGEKLYCMWQSSPTDEDSDDTWVACSQSEDGGQTWCPPQALALPTDTTYCTSGGWMVRGDTLIALIDTWRKGLNPRGGETHYIMTTDGRTWSERKPLLMADGTAMKGVLEQDPCQLPSGRMVGASHFQPGLHVCPVFTDDPTGLTGWTKAIFLPLPTKEADSKQSRELEPSQFVQADGTLVMTFRDQQSSFRKLASFSHDDGHSWSVPVVTAIPDARTKQCAGNLSDGTAFMVSCPADGKRRWPLLLFLSRDGRLFDRAVLLRSGASTDLPLRRYEGKAKTLGYSYPKAMVSQGCLYVGYSTNKETVECTRIPLSLIQTGL